MAACCGKACEYNYVCEVGGFGECKGMDDIIDRLASIEDILGDYDLDRLRELVEADREGRCVVIPDVDKRARESMADGLQEVFKEWSYEDSSVGLFGMSDGEKELASALIYALEGEEDRRDG